MHAERQNSAHQNRRHGKLDIYYNLYRCKEHTNERQNERVDLNEGQSQLLIFLKQKKKTNLNRSWGMK